MVKHVSILIYLYKFFTVCTLLDEVLPFEIINENLNTEINVLSQKYENI